jgi:glutamyl-tRNA synthetase
MISLFELSDVNKSAAAINPDKLSWLNQQYLKDYDNETLASLLKEQFERLSIDCSDGPSLTDLCMVQKERVKTVQEMALQSRYFYENFEEFAPDAAKKHLRPVILEALQNIKGLFVELDSWEADSIQQAIKEFCEKYQIKMGKVAQPLRVAVTGNSVSPSIDITMELIGKERVLNRLDKALEFIQTRSQLDTSEGVT